MSVENLAQYTLGETEGNFICQGVEEHEAVALALIQQAEWHIDIFTRYFEPRVYGTPEFTEAIEQLALDNYRCRIRILLQEPKQTVARGHRVIEIGKHLSSFFQLRETDETHRKLPQAFFIVDSIAYMYQPHADALKSEVSFCDGPQALQLIEQFEELWFAGAPSPWLRNLKI